MASTNHGGYEGAAEQAAGRDLSKRTSRLSLPHGIPSVPARIVSVVSSCLP